MGQGADAGTEDDEDEKSALGAADAGADDDAVGDVAVRKC